MKIKEINDSWGSVVEFKDPQDFFLENSDYWRNLIYERKLIVFKGMDFSNEDYVKFCLHFGRPWDRKDYHYSTETTKEIFLKKIKFFISPYSNKISQRLKDKEVHWHADIPNRDRNPFPFRSLWMIKNPNPEAGFTSWLNIEQGIDFLPQELKEDIENIKILQQSWYEENTDVKEFDFIKIHPITGKKSLRLNYFCVKEEGITDAWIKSIKINGTHVTDIKPILGSYIKCLTSIDKMIYTHKWNTFDIVIYDNWSFMHNRTHLNLSQDEERLMYRCNIDHLTEIEWAAHKKLLRILK